MFLARTFRWQTRCPEKIIPAEPEDSDTIEDLDMQVHCLFNNMPVSDKKMQQLRRATVEDPSMQKLQSTILEGWPELPRNCKPTISEFWNFRHQLSTLDGIIFKGEKILVPASLRPEMIQKIHSSHLDIEKTKQRALEILFWPCLATQIHNAIATCPICAPTRPSNSKQPLMLHEIPSLAEAGH